MITIILIILSTNIFYFIDYVKSSLIIDDILNNAKKIYELEDSNNVTFFEYNKKLSLK